MSNKTTEFKEVILEGLQHIELLETKVKLLNLEKEEINGELVSSNKRVSELEASLKEALMYNSLYADKICRLKAKALGVPSFKLDYISEAELNTGKKTPFKEPTISASNDALTDTDIERVLEKGARIGAGINEVDALNKKIEAKLKDLESIKIGNNVDAHI